MSCPCRNRWPDWPHHNLVVWLCTTGNPNLSIILGFFKTVCTGRYPYGIYNLQTSRCVRDICPCKKGGWILYAENFCLSVLKSFSAVEFKKIHNRGTWVFRLLNLKYKKSHNPMVKKPLSTEALGFLGQRTDPIKKAPYIYLNTPHNSNSLATCRRIQTLPLNFHEERTEEVEESMEGETSP